MIPIYSEKYCFVAFCWDIPYIAYISRYSLLSGLCPTFNIHQYDVFLWAAWVLTFLEITELARLPSHSLVYGLNFKQTHIMGDSVLAVLFGFLPSVPKKAWQLSLSEELPSSQWILEFSAGALICLPVDCDLKYAGL